ncbi:MAG: hypothetical protein U5N55_04945 [Cypionkella sp.]|nr:hypothetical protein [Cypionkella sp.]
MTDEERERIKRETKADAELENRVKNLETDLGEVKGAMIWGIRAIWGAVAYLASQVWDFVANGGVLK